MEKLQFEVSSGLKSIIGKDLITNDIVAIFELVKNSYDAGASRVDIIFSTSIKKIIRGNEFVNAPYKNKIYIIDNGKGMNFGDIKNKWLKVAYSAKSDGSEDIVDKAYAGNKGVGRFSADRLGSSLKLQAKTVDDATVCNIDVEWGDFDKNPKNLFNSIDINYFESTEIKLPEEFKEKINSGVVIEISSLREPFSWDSEKLLNLKRSLIKLVDPFGDNNKAFEIYITDLSSSNHDRSVLEKNNGDDELDLNPSLINGKIENSIINTLKEKTTYISVKLEGSSFYTSLVDRGELIYKTKESFIEDSFLKDSGLKIELFFLNRSAKTTFTRRMGTQAVNYGSVFLFRNGFRVFPVGEEDNDFWGLNRRKQQGHSRYLGSRDLLGKVEVWGTETNFKEASSRDMGLIKTAASEELKSFILTNAIKKLESYVVNIQWSDIYDKDLDTPERMYRDENKAKILNLVTKLSGNKNIELLEYNTNIISIFNEKSKLFSSTVTKLEELAEKTNNSELLKLVYDASKRYEIEKTRAEEAQKQADVEQALRRDAERKAKLESIKRAEEETKRKSAEEKAQKYQEVSKQERARNLFLTSMETNRDKEKLESFIHQLIIYSSATKDLIADEIYKINNEEDYNKSDFIDILSDILNNNEKIITTSRFAVFADFMLDSACINEDLAKYISQYIDEIITAYHQRIKITSVIPKELEFITRFSPIELGLLFDNLISNSQKAKASEVIVSAKVEKNKLLIVEVSDNGRGIDTDVDKNRIFDKGYTTTDGSGLGLYHVKEAVDNLGGEVLMTPEQPNRGTSFTIRIKKNEANI